MINTSTRELNLFSRAVVHDRLNGYATRDLGKEIIEGLTSDKKYIASKFFYDPAGSALFEAITQLPEYYPGRTEKAILQANAIRLMNQIGYCDIVELGSGDCSKIRILLSAMDEAHRQQMYYMPVDFSRSAIEQASNNLLQLFPHLHIEGYVADFLDRLDYLPARQKRLFCFLGGTIGNLSPAQTIRFLSSVRHVMNGNDEFLLGMDMVKEREVMERAYNDKDKVTEQFNKNILKVVNAITGTRFEPDHFNHIAFFNPAHSRIEMHLEARFNMEITSPRLPEGLILKKGETLHTENSYKFSIAQIEQLASESRLNIKEIYTDANQWFSVVRFDSQSA